MGVNNPNFPSNVLNETEALQYLGYVVKSMRTQSYAAVTGSPTLTAAQIVDSAVEISGGSTATVTSDTAVAIIARMQAIDANAGVGSTANFMLINDNSGALTFTMGTGCSLVDPTPTLAAGAAKRYLIKILTTTTVSFTRI